MQWLIRWPNCAQYCATMVDLLIAPGASICAGLQVIERGNGVRFNLTIDGRVEPAFLVRFGDAVYAYRNQCAHIPMELDWNAGKFFDSEQQLLLCSTHGAAYDPISGACLSGPCRNGELLPVRINERGRLIYLEG